MADLTLIRPFIDAWGDGGLALYRDGQLVAETALSAAQVRDLPGSERIAGGLDVSLDQTSQLAEALGLNLTEMTYDDSWLGRVGAFPDQLADVVLYDAEREQ